MIINKLKTSELYARLAKLDKVIATHPQKSMRAKAGSAKQVCLNEITRRLRDADADTLAAIDKLSALWSNNNV